VGFFNTLLVFASGDSAKKTAITRSKFGRVIASLPNLSGILDGPDPCMQFDLASQLMSSLVPGVHDL
jgi:hypothetical protein